MIPSGERAFLPSPLMRIAGYPRASTELKGVYPRQASHIAFRSAIYQYISMYYRIQEA